MNWREAKAQKKTDPGVSQDAEVGQRCPRR